MTALCIDTATEHGIVAVARDDGQMSSSTWRAAGRHGENLFEHIDRALSDAGVTRDALSSIGVDIGPGKFTSLRVGLSTAKGLALGLGLPVVGVESLRVLARSIEGGSARVRVPLMTAYRGEVFGAAYVWKGDMLDEVVAPAFGSPDGLLRRIADALAGRAAVVGGEGARAHAPLVHAALGVDVSEAEQSAAAPTAAALVEEVRDASRRHGPSDLEALEPKYLRPSDAKLPDRALRARRDA